MASGTRPVKRWIERAVAVAAIGRSQFLAVCTGLALLAGCTTPLRMANVPPPDARSFVPTVASLSNSLISRGHVTGFWTFVPAIYQARLRAISRAQRTVHFETYYMTPGPRADGFADALVARAKAGVRVCFIADAQGTYTLPKAYWRRLRDAGVLVRFYNPFDMQRPWAYNTRTHRKILNIDGRITLTGGTGVSDEWEPKGSAPWADAEIQLEGPVVSAMEGVFAQHWTQLGGTADLGPDVFEASGDRGVRMIVTPSGPRDGGSPLRTLYHASMLSARKRIWIASPYFLPSATEVKAMIKAHERGVDVRILTVGKLNDQPLTWFAAREWSRRLLKAGVPILEYQPAMMHAKVMLVDENWVVTGSANFDPRSFWHNDELTIAANDPGLAKPAESYFHSLFRQARPLQQQDLESRDIWTLVQGRAALSLWWYL